MSGKYKKMSLAVAACTLLGVSASDAAVTLTFAQSGPNVTATWSGTYALPTATTSSPTAYSARIGPTTAAGDGIPLHNAGSHDAGVPENTGLATISLADQYVGESFGFLGTFLIYPIGQVGDYSPTGTMTFPNTTLAALGASSFSNTLAFTGTGNVGGNKTISFTTIPEPSGVALAALGCLGLAFRRRAR